MQELKLFRRVKAMPPRGARQNRVHPGHATQQKLRHPRGLINERQLLRALAVPSGSKFACRLGFLGNIRNSEHIIAGRSSPVLVPNEKIVQFHIIRAIIPFIS